MPDSIFKFDSSTVMNPQSDNLRFLSLKQSVGGPGSPDLASPKSETIAQIDFQPAQRSAELPAKELFCFAHKECLLGYAKILNISTEKDDCEIVKQLLSLEPRLQENDVLAKTAFRVKSSLQARVIPSPKVVMQATYRELQNYAKAQIPSIKANSKTEVIQCELIERRTTILIRYIVEQDSWNIKHADDLGMITSKELQMTKDIDSKSSIGGLGPIKSECSENDTKIQESFIKPESSLITTDDFCFGCTELPCGPNPTPLTSDAMPRILLTQATTKARNVMSTASSEYLSQEIGASSTRSPLSYSMRDSSEETYKEDDSRIYKNTASTKDVNATSIPALRPSDMPTTISEGLISLASKELHLETEDHCSNMQVDPLQLKVPSEVPSPSSLMDLYEAHRRSSTSARVPSNNAPHDIRQIGPGIPGSSSDEQPARLGSVQQANHHSPGCGTEKQELATVLDKFVELRKLDMEERIKRDVIICVGMLLCMLLARITA